MRLLKVKKNTSECSIEKYKEIKNKVLILRESGGFGDILNMRMIFQDLKQTYAEFEFDWALPSGYFPAAQGVPYVRKLVPVNNFSYNDYISVYNMTYSCGRYEWKNKKSTSMNRADVWAESIGAKLTNHNMFMPDYSKHFNKLESYLKNIGWDSNKRIIAFAPFSAIDAKNMTFQQIKFIKDMTKDFFLVAIHNQPSLELAELKIPCMNYLTLEESMSFIQLSDYVISTDTGHVHCAGGYGKPTLGMFCYTDGNLICKYYKSVFVVQKFDRMNEDHCGPCYNIPNCPKSKEKQKPCRTEINLDNIKSAWEKVLNTSI